MSLFGCNIVLHLLKTISFTIYSPGTVVIWGTTWYEVLIDIWSCLQSLPKNAGYDRVTEYPVEIKVTKFSKAKFWKALLLHLICLFLPLDMRKVKCLIDLPQNCRESEWVAILQQFMAEEVFLAGTTRRDQGNRWGCAPLPPPNPANWVTADSYYNQTGIQTMKSDWDVIRLLGRRRNNRAKSVSVTEVLGLSMFIIKVPERLILYTGFLFFWLLSDFHDAFLHYTEQWSIAIL